MSETKLVRPGVWTPWAQVLCLPCHGPTFNRGFGDVKTIPKEDMRTLIEPDSDEAITRCEKCLAEIAVRDDVARLHNLLLAIGDDKTLWQSKVVTGTAMEQTGGMCAALRIHLTGGYSLMVACMDGPYSVGLYHDERSSSIACALSGSPPYDDEEMYLDAFDVPSYDTEAEVLELLLTIDAQPEALS